MPRTPRTRAARASSACWSSGRRRYHPKMLRPQLTVCLTSDWAYSKCEARRLEPRDRRREDKSVLRRDQRGAPSRGDGDGDGDGELDADELRRCVDACGMATALWSALRRKRGCSFFGCRSVWCVAARRRTDGPGLDGCVGYARKFTWPCRIHAVLCRGSVEEKGLARFCLVVGYIGAD